jgi:large subunit ribosomal protein L17
MKHRIGFNRLSRKTSHRKAMLRNMVTSLFEHERISTTKAKALELRRVAEKMITRAKVDSVHNRRMAARFIWDKGIVNKLFTELGPRFVARNGGYCRILKIGHRQGDAADMVIIELLDREGEESSKPEKAEKKASKAKKETSAEKVTKAEKKPASKSVKKAEVEAPVDTVEKVETEEAVAVDDTAEAEKPGSSEPEKETEEKQ